MSDSLFDQNREFINKLQNEQNIKESVVEEKLISIISDITIKNSNLEKTYIRTREHRFRDYIKKDNFNTNSNFEWFYCLLACLNEYGSLLKMNYHTDFKDIKTTLKICLEKFEEYLYL